MLQETVDHFHPHANLPHFSTWSAPAAALAMKPEARAR